MSLAARVVPASAIMAMVVILVVLIVAGTGIMRSVSEAASGGTHRTSR